jgi:hypothetical protein
MSDKDKTQSVVTWNENDSASKENAMAEFSEAMDSYHGVSKGNHRSFLEKTKGGHRDFLDIEPNKSVRPGFNHSDYYAFRSNEQVPTEKKKAISMCMQAYDKVGIIRNIIDLMGDFGSQGINVVHENPSVEKFFQAWFKKVDGKERSERFLNNLYRTGQVFVYKSDAKVTPKIVKHIKSIANDITVRAPNTKKGILPWRYNFLNPLNIELKDGDINMMMGRASYEIETPAFLDNFSKDMSSMVTYNTLPPNIKQAIKRKDKRIPLDDTKLSVYYYKKDDWQQWANPLVYAILDDIIMLEKMRLADLSALDGAISNIRLWTLGDLEHKILPTKAGVDKLKNVLASDTGGGTMELIWGPELKYTESNSMVYKFLGSEKYVSVLNSIYAGLGVPPTLTGMAGQSGGFTNNFISLKTLVERLQYGRDQLIKFWDKEFDIVRRSMGFRKPAHITFDQMSLTDEGSEKKLLLELADRDIISHETILERFKEIPAVEKMRLKREVKVRDNDRNPDKVGPYHPPKEDEMEYQQPKDNKNGRPKFKKDEIKRKPRRDKPKTKPGVANLFIWANNTFDRVSTLINSAHLGVKGKKDARHLTKADIIGLEPIKLHAFTNIEVMSEVTDESINIALSSEQAIPKDFDNMLKTHSINIKSMNADEYKKAVIALYVEYVLG